MNTKTEDLEYPLPCPFTKPYKDDLEYLGHELEWIEQRCLRLGAQRRLAAPADDDPLAESATTGLDDTETRRLELAVKRYDRAEHRLRSEIDRRLEELAPNYDAVKLLD